GPANGEAPGRQADRLEDGHVSRRILRPREESPGVHRHRGEGGGPAPHRRQEVDRRRVRPRILHLAHGLRGGPQEAAGPGRDLRACALGAQGERLRRCGRDRKLREVRPQLVHLHERPPVGIPRHARPRGWHHLHQRADDRGRGPVAVRRDEGDRAHGHSRGRDDGAGGVHLLEDRLRRLLRPAPEGADRHGKARRRPATGGVGWAVPGRLVLSKTLYSSILYRTIRLCSRKPFFSYTARAGALTSSVMTYITPKPSSRACPTADRTSRVPSPWP